MTELRFKKSTKSGVEGNCVQLAHTLTVVRDSKNGATLQGVDARRLITLARTR